MDDATALNDRLREHHPATFRSLSPLGLRAAFPRGIPFQADEARSSRIDATIGQLTDGEGRPMPIPAMLRSIDGLDSATAFLYSPVDGPRQVRELWAARERRLAGSPSTPASVPTVTHGLTHALSVVADLFADPDTDVLVPQPAWENYELLFSIHANARIHRYRLFDGVRFDESGLAEALKKVRKKGVLVLNFPSNPNGWSPNPSQAARIVNLVASHPGPLVAVTDDAYQSWIYEPGLHGRSLFWDLADVADPERLLVVKCDGATKELVFFSSRVGFLTHTATGDAEPALLSKVKYVLRGTVGPASGPALAMTSRALRDPDLEGALTERRGVLAERYHTLKAGLDGLDPDRVRVLPFNSAFFVFLELPASVNADAVRKRLLAESSVGTIAFPAENALRLAYCSIHNDRLPELVDAVAKALGQAPRG